MLVLVIKINKIVYVYTQFNSNYDSLYREDGEFLSPAKIESWFRP